MHTKMESGGNKATNKPYICSPGSVQIDLLNILSFFIPTAIFKFLTKKNGIFGNEIPSSEVGAMDGAVALQCSRGSSNTTIQVQVYTAPSLCLH